MLGASKQINCPIIRSIKPKNRNQINPQTNFSTNISDFLAVMQIQLNYYTDLDPGSGNPPYKSGSGSKKKKYRYLLTDIEQQLYIKLARTAEVT